MSRLWTDQDSRWWLMALGGVVACVAGVAALFWLISHAVAVDRSASFVPSPATAESAIRAGLEAWKRGDPPGTIEGKPMIHFIDSHRTPKLILKDFEILGQVPGNAPRCFAVRVIFDQPAQEERLRYVVLGIDPLWVWRQEDYDLLCHWEHPMEPASTEAADK